MKPQLTFSPLLLFQCRQRLSLLSLLFPFSLSSRCLAPGHPLLLQDIPHYSSLLCNSALLHTMHATHCSSYLPPKHIFIKLSATPATFYLLCGISPSFHSFMNFELAVWLGCTSMSVFWAPYAVAPWTPLKHVAFLSLGPLSLSFSTRDTSLSSLFWLILSLKEREKLISLMGSGGLDMG